jgi:hypothetical protein
MKPAEAQRRAAAERAPRATHTFGTWWVVPWTVACAGAVALLADRAQATSALPSALLGLALALVAAGALKLVGVLRGPILERVLAGYGLAAVVGAVVVWDNHVNTGLHYSTSFDDSFYWFNTVWIARHGLESASHFTLFEVLLAQYHRVLEDLCGGVQPVDLLPFNWCMGALCVLLAGECAQALSARPLPIPWLLATTLGNVGFSTTTSLLHRDPLVAFGYLGAALAGLRGQGALGLAFAAVAFATRGAHGVLALGALGACLAVRTAWFQARPRLFAALGALAMVGFIVAGSAASAGFLSGRQGAAEDRSVADLAAERSEQITTHAQTVTAQSSLGALVLSLGPVGIPLRMVSAWFAPVVLRSPAQARSLNTQFLPGSMGDHYKLWGNYRATWLEWCTVLLWVPLAPLLLRGLGRLRRGGSLRRAFLFAHAGTLLAVVAISGQERHRLPVLLLNAAVVAVALGDQSPAERARRRLEHTVTLLALVALNLVQALRAM